MKFIVVLLLFLSVVVARPQGQLIFDNLVNNLVVAPVYGVEPSEPDQSKHGNTTTGTPAGTQVYSGSALQGTGFTAQLFAGSARAVVPNLQPLFPAVHFRTNERAGFVNAPNLTVGVPAVAAGEPARVVLRAWDNRGGSISNWNQVMADPTIPHGESLSFVTPPLGGLLNAPPNLVGLESFNLATGVVAASGWKINFQPDSTSAPPGYIPDSGLSFGSRPGELMFGWNVSHTSAARQRQATNSPDVRHDTFIEMSPSPQTQWEIAVPNGVYGVHVAAGDPSTLAGVYRINAEDILLLQGTPVPGQNWIEADGIVEVKDGRLTLSNGPGSFTNRLCFVEIAPIDRPSLQWTVNPAAEAPFAFEFSAAAGVRYQVQESSDLVQFTSHGTNVATQQGRLRFVDASSAAISYRVYRTRTLTTPSAQIVYTNSFTTNAGTEWSHGSVSVAPRGQTFLGPCF